VEVFVARDGREALRYLHGEGQYADRVQHPFPWLTLLDLNLPYVPGLQVLKQIRKHPDLRKLIVVVLTSSLADSDLDEAYALGANSYLSKPVAEVQGHFPEWMYVVTPTEQFEPEPYRFAEYAAYCRYIKTRFERLCDAPPDSVKTYPEPVPHCPICRWFAECDKKRRDDDHHG